MNKNQETVLINIIGNENFSKLERFAFEYASLENEHFGLTSVDPAFKLIYIMRRHLTLNEVYGKIMNEGIKTNYRFKFISNEEMRTRINAMYDRGNGVKI